jgi:twitching motility two-component system response regulator PilH
MGNAGRKRILVIDDEEEVAEVVIRILEQNGFSASAVTDPLHAPQRAAEFRPDLIILDFNMPKLVGPELAVLLKSRSETKNTPVIFLSGMTDEDHQELGRFSGASAYLEKPIDPVRLLETIRSLLAGDKKS